jgi:hypothetical protein
MTMTMTVETPPPDRIRPAAVAGVLLSRPGTGGAR